MKLERNKQEYDIFDEVRKGALIIGVSVLIGAFSYGIVNSFIEKFEKYGIPKVTYYNVDKGIERMNKALDLRDEGKCGSLEDCFVKSGEKQ